MSTISWINFGYSVDGLGHLFLWFKDCITIQNKYTKLKEHKGERNHDYAYEIVNTAYIYTHIYIHRERERE